MPRWSHEERRFVRKSKDDADADNAVMRFILAYLVCPTPMSAIARQIRSALQNETYGQKPEMRSKVTGALAWKHRLESGADPRMAELLSVFTEEFMSWR